MYTLHARTRARTHARTHARTRALSLSRAPTHPPTHTHTHTQVSAWLREEPQGEGSRAQGTKVEDESLRQAEILSFLALRTVR